MHTRNPVLLISGPTGTGKSPLGVSLAKRLDGEIINIDSVQIYRGLDIGSAKISLDQRCQVPHHLIDIYDPNHSGNVADFVANALTTIDEIQKRGKLCILVGGTTMYVTALFHGLAQLPRSDPKVRSNLESQDTATLYRRLTEVDSGRATKLHHNDRLRIIRALESSMISDTPVSALHEAHAFKDAPLRALMLVQLLDRDRLYESLNRRSREMVEAGLLEEVKQLRKKFGENLNCFNSIGYREALACLKGEIPESDLAAEIAMQTRRFAKRQMTYWRNEPIKRGWRIRPGADEKSTIISGSSQSKRGAVTPFRALPYTKSELAHNISISLPKIDCTNEVWYIDAGGLVD